MFRSCRDLTPPPPSGETQLSSWLCSQPRLPARAPLSSHVGLPGTPPVMLPWHVLVLLLDPLCPLVFREMSRPLVRLRGHRRGEAVLAAPAVLRGTHWFPSASWNRPQPRVARLCSHSAWLAVGVLS